MYSIIVELLFTVGMFANALLFIPQAIRIYREKSAHNLSLITFGGFNLIQIAMVLHGFLHEDWFLIAGMGVSFFTCALVTIQIIFSRLREWKSQESIK